MKFKIWIGIIGLVVTTILQYPSYCDGLNPAITMEPAAENLSEEQVPLATKLVGINLFIFTAIGFVLYGLPGVAGVMACQQVVHAIYDPKSYFQSPPAGETVEVTIVKCSEATLSMGTPPEVLTEDHTGAALFALSVIGTLVFLWFFRGFPPPPPPPPPGGFSPGGSSPGGFSPSGSDPEGVEWSPQELVAIDVGSPSWWMHYVYYFPALLSNWGSIGVNFPVVHPLLGPMVVNPLAGPVVGPVVVPVVGPVVVPAIGPVVGPAIGPVVVPAIGPVVGPAIVPAVVPEIAPVVVEIASTISTIIP